MTSSRFGNQQHNMYDKMAATLIDNIFICIPLNENALISIKISQKWYSYIGSDNGLAPTRRQAIIWTNDDYFAVLSLYHFSSVAWSTAQYDSRIYNFVVLSRCPYNR